ncbi:uncharacterized protein LOC132717506 [Ruditapes philippinarum]|uniref:uncharacterized protein LOC132717506 n=1 Tax=Ruditapes philippinarum TaxID=129788 RepID=UPI00295BCF70|nr:uncharacterized protein LOC132717506 [Ruditapes philippinarum]
MAEGAPIAEQQSSFAFKVTNCMRRRTLGVIAKDFGQLKYKCEQKFGLENTMFVLEEDSCEVDDEYLSVLPPDTKLMCLGEGETWSIKRKEPASEQGEENIMTLIEDLRKKKLKAERHQAFKPKERTVSVQVGWSNYSFKDQRYQLVKTTRDKPNSGPRMIKLDRKLTMSSVANTLKDLFFPQGKSPLGSQRNFTFNVGNFQGDIINRTVTVDEYVSTHTKPRLYLLSKAATLLSALDSDSDSDFELPPIVFNTRQHQATATVTSDSIGNLNDVVINVDPTVTPPGTPTAPTEQTGSTDVFLNSGTPTNVTTRAATFLRANVVFNRQSFTPKCTICMERDRNAFLIPCGHQYCMVCATHLEGTAAPCAFCRRVISSVGRLM